MLIESLKRLYPEKITIEKLNDMLENKIITIEEYNEIVGGK